jgi:hypothetical protein
LAVLHSAFRLEEPSELAHFRNGKKEGIWHAQIEVLLPLHQAHHLFLEMMVPLLKGFAGEAGLWRVEFQYIWLTFNDGFFLEGCDFRQFRICLDDDAASKFP